MAKYWSFGFSPSNEYSGLISFRMDWLDLLAVQGTLKSLLQHHSLKPDVHPASSPSSSSPPQESCPNPHNSLWSAPHLHKPPLSLPCPRPHPSRMLSTCAAPPVVPSHPHLKREPEAQSPARTRPSPEPVEGRRGWRGDPGLGRGPGGLGSRHQSLAAPLLRVCTGAVHGLQSPR